MADNMIKKIILRWLDEPVDPRYEREIETRLAEESHGPYRAMGWIILAAQSFMVLTFAVRPGGLFATPRRTGYICLYLLLILITALFLFMARRAAGRGEGRRLLPMGTAYAAVVCLWCCCVTLLDQLGGNGLIVYSYMMPMTAALTLLRPRMSALLFFGSFLFLNLLLPSFPGGMHNLFSNVVNSMFITLLSFYLSVRLYYSKVRAQYDTIIIRQQMEEIQLINQQLRHMTITDPLTRLHNRRYLEEQVRRLLEQADVPLGPVSGLMADIDFFKGFNDNFGHQAGDDALRQVAEQVLRFGNDTDRFAVRYGGEEFFLCLFNCDANQALETAEQLRRAVEERNVPRSDLQMGRVTISVGVACLPAGQPRDLQELVRQADRALYQAKVGGRNRVFLYEPGLSNPPQAL